LDQFSLGMPSRDYFLEPAYQRYKNAYTKYMVDLATYIAGPAANSTQITNDVDDMIAFETDMANVSLKDLAQLKNRAVGSQP